MCSPEQYRNSVPVTTKGHLQMLSLGRAEVTRKKREVGTEESEAYRRGSISWTSSSWCHKQGTSPASCYVPSLFSPSWFYRPERSSSVCISRRTFQPINIPSLCATSCFVARGEAIKGFGNAVGDLIHFLAKRLRIVLTVWIILLVLTLTWFRHDKTHM